MIQVMLVDFLVDHQVLRTDLQVSRVGSILDFVGHLSSHHLCQGCGPSWALTMTASGFSSLGPGRSSERITFSLSSKSMTLHGR
jgi:hypothetical protein